MSWRDNMTNVAIFFMIFGFGFLGAGFLFTLYNAFKHSKKKE